MTFWCRTSTAFHVARQRLATWNETGVLQGVAHPLGLLGCDTRVDHDVVVHHVERRIRLCGSIDRIAQIGVDTRNVLFCAVPCPVVLRSVVTPVLLEHMV